LHYYYNRNPNWLPAGCFEKYQHVPRLKGYFLNPLKCNDVRWLVTFQTGRCHPGL